jgi:hypothetical protein
MEKMFGATIALLLIVASSASATQLPTATPSDALELVVLKTVAQQKLGWMFPEFESDETKLDMARYRASQVVMAGAVDSIEILRYTTSTQAAAAFSTSGDMFHGQPANQGSYSNYQSGHYQNLRWFAWLNGRRSYHVTTMYNSTYPGNAADPVPIAEIVYTEAISHGLTLTDAYLPMIVTP